jgi:RNA polymerase sigma-70 factor (ECF subfamily)
VAAALSRAPVDRDTERRFRLGERAAFEAIYDAHASALRALVGRFFPSPFEREEAVQEVWLLIHRVAGTFDAERGELLPWLRAVAANRCKELLRARGRRPDARVELDEAALAEEGSPDPEASARAARVREAVRRFSDGLDAEEALVFRLSILEERAHEEAARAAGISPRRCKYLRAKLLARAAANAELRAAIEEVTAS